jgi:hypothetical protein
MNKTKLTGGQRQNMQQMAWNAEGGKEKLFRHCFLCCVGPIGLYDISTVYQFDWVPKMIMRWAIVHMTMNLRVP